MKKKKIWYTILFMAFNLIEWVRATQDGDWWKVAANCTGFVMMCIIVSAYPLREFASLFSAVWTGLCGAGLLGVYLYWKCHTVPFILWQYLTGVMNIWWIGMVLLLLLRRLKRGEWKWPGWNTMGLLGAAMAFFCIFSRSGRVWPLWFLFMFGIFYLTGYTQEHREALIEGMVNGHILSFFAMQIYAFGFRPYDEVRYKGALSNCNMMALYYLIIYCMVLVKIHLLRKKDTRKGWFLFWIFGAGTLLAFQFMTLCRTALLSAFAVTAVYGICSMRGVWRDSFKRICAGAAGLALSAMAAFLPVFLSIRYFPVILHHPIWYEGEYSIDKVHSFDPPDSWKYVEMDEFLEEAFGRFARVFQSSLQDASPAEEAALKGRQETGETAALQGGQEMRETAALQGGQETGDAAVYASESINRHETPKEGEKPILEGDRQWTSWEIRREIWRLYIRDLNLRGHSESEGYYLITPEYRSWHAQNLWLQIAYYYGIPAGLLLVVLTVYMFRFYPGGLRKGKCHRYFGIIPVLIITLYFTFGLLETTWNIGQLIVTLFFLVQHPMFWKKGDLLRQKSKESSLAE